MYDFNKIDKTLLQRRAFLKWGIWGEDVISLALGDIDFPPPPEIKDEITRVLEENRTFYSEPAGDSDVLEVICDKLNRVNRIPATLDDVHMIPGTMFGIFLACYYGLLPGSEAIICPSPVYSHFMDNVKLEGGVPVHCSFDFNNKVRGDLVENLRRCVSPRTKLIMVCNPHNPTGSVLTREELEGIAEVALEHDLLIFADELYEDLIFEGKHVSIASLSKEVFERTLTVFGFSKAFGMAGLRIAYLVGHGKHMENIKERLFHVIVHSDRMAQAAGKAALARSDRWLDAYVTHLRRMRDYALARLVALPNVWCTEPDSGQFLFPNLSAYGMTSAGMTDYLLKEARVAVECGSDFGPDGEGHIRINYATAEPILREAFDRIEVALRKIS